ncbi:MAG TPA: DUF4381 domain-containing protein, partial [Acetobacteraceae bacterium]|nr:DUF4381 domain-containing protein [Acetobacteraceae bacterium]
ALPAPIAWWPLQFGWWVVAACLLAIVLLLLADGVRRYRRNAYRRAALRSLRELAAAPPEMLASQVAEILKRAALAAYPRESVAGLTGTAWSEFLARTGGLAVETSAVLGRAAVNPSHPLNASQAGAVLAGAQAWIRRHKRGSALP